MIFSKYHYCTLNQKDSDYHIIFKLFIINHKRQQNRIQPISSHIFALQGYFYAAMRKSVRHLTKILLGEMAHNHQGSRKTYSM